METNLGRLRRRAIELGFDRLGACDLRPSERSALAYRTWLDAGMAGEMSWMSRPDRLARALDPASALPGARSLVVVTRGYHAGALPAALRDDPSRGILAAYAWGVDYHDVLLRRLEALGAFVDEALGAPTARRAFVDFGPLLERDAAARAGLGFIGRNTMLIDPRAGSWSFLGALAVDAPVEDLVAGDDDAASDAAPAGTCGSCTRCLVACPTGAFPAPYVLDARRCISYLTIELRGPIPRDLRPLLGNRIFGCDVCNDVCPYNRRFARPAADPELAPGPERAAPRLLELARLDDDGFAARFAGSPVLRPKRAGLLRNVCVAIGNWGDPVAVPALEALAGDDSPLVRGHAAWALGRIGGPVAARLLERARRSDPVAWVREEAEAALGADGP